MTKYRIHQSRRFKKDFKALQHNKKAVAALKEVVNLLANGETLPKEYHDHVLVGGSLQGKRECHIFPDLLLIYVIYEDILVLDLGRVSSHAKLLGL